MNATVNKLNTVEEITSYVKNAVQEYNKTGNKDIFIQSILSAVKAVDIDNVVKITKLTRVEIYDTLDGVNPSFDTLTRILAVFGVKVNFTFDENASQIKMLK